MGVEPLNDLEKYVEELLLKSGAKDYKIEEAKITIKRLLSTTGHVPSVHGIARGAGYCSIYARLYEAVGAGRGYLRDKIAGKGSDVHKIVGMALLSLFLEGRHNQLLSGRDKESSRAIIEGYLSGAIEELKREKIIQENEFLKSVARSLISKFFESLPKMCSALSLRIDELFPVVEQQFVDYDLHIRGSPDFILEDRGERKAIVVEWKTSPSPSALFERAQVICYAMLEARRLGYGGRSVKFREELVGAVLGRLEGGRVEGVKVLPVIIRPIEGGELEPHPILAPPAKVVERYRKMKMLIDNVIIEAQHLTVLLTNQVRLAGVMHDEYLVPIGRGGVRVNALRCTPRQLWRGNPREQNRYPCTAGKSKKPICDLRSACRFYYAREFGEMEEYERVLWGIRYQVFDEKEQNLLIYRALHHIFERCSKSEVVNKLKDGKGAVIGLDLPISVSFSYADFVRNRRRPLAGKILVRRSVRDDRGRILTEEAEKRVEVLDRVEIEGRELVGLRKRREYERDSLHVIGEGEPVLVTPVDGPTPLLSINFFGRVEDVDVEGGLVKYVIVVASKLQSYQRLLFQRMLRAGKSLRENLLMVEVDADLTRLDLNALDSLQRLLKERAESGEYSEEIRRELVREAKLIESELERAYSREDPDGRSLSELLRKLVGAAEG